MRLPWILLIGALVACGRTGLRPGERAGSSGVGGAGGGAGAGAGGVGGAGGAGGADPCDVDLDGHRAPSCGGDDCNDADPTIHPGAPDTNATIGPWVSEEITPGSTDGGEPPTIAVDRSGVVHLAYVEEGLHHATNRTGAWVTTLIDPSAVGIPSIVVDASGSPRVVYRAPGGVYLTTKSEGAWISALADPQGEGDPTLALDPGSAEHFCYAGAGGLHCAALTPAGFVIEIVDPSPAKAPSVAVAPDGIPHVVYTLSDTDELRHAVRARPGAWTIATIAPGRYAAPALTFDASGVAHVSYAVREVDPGGVRYGRSAGGSWEIDLIDDDIAFRTSIGLDAWGVVHVAHDITGMMKYATRAPGQPWKTENLLFGWNHGTMTVEPAGAAHVGFSDFLFGVNNFIGYGTNRALNPDGIDQNCDGVDGVDADGDGHASLPTGGDDCDDTAPGIACQ